MKRQILLTLFLLSFLLITPSLRGFQQSHPSRFAADMQQVGDSIRVKIPDGTGIHLVIKNSASSESSRKNDLLEFVVAEPVIVNGIAVISAGTIARGTVVQAEKSTEKKNGFLAWTLQSVNAVDGAPVSVRLVKIPFYGVERLSAASVASDVGWTALGIALSPFWLAEPGFADYLRFPRMGGPTPRAGTADVTAGEHFLVFVSNDITVAAKAGSVLEPTPSDLRELTAAKGASKSSQRWSFIQFDLDTSTIIPDSDWPQFLSNLQAKLGKAATDGYRLVAACSTGLVLEKVANPFDIFRYRLLPGSLSRFRTSQAAANQAGAYGYQWWHNTLGSAWWLDKLCLIAEKAPGRPNQFQYVFPSENRNRVETKKEVDQTNQRFSQLYRAGYRNAFYIQGGVVMERAAEVLPPASSLDELDAAQPYLWLRAPSSQFRREILAAAARGYRVVNCSLVTESFERSYNCLLTKPARPRGGIYDYRFFLEEPARLSNFALLLNDSGSRGYRLHAALPDEPLKGREIGLLLENDPEGMAQHVYDVFVDKSIEALLSSMNAAAEKGGVLKKIAFLWPDWVSIIERNHR